MSYTFGTKFPNHFINPAFLTLVKSQGYVSQLIDKNAVLKALAWSGITQLDFEAFLIPTKISSTESIYSATVRSFTEIIVAPIESLANTLLADLDLHIVINTTIGNVQFLNPDFTKVNYSVDAGKANYKLYFEYTSSSSSDPPQERIALYIATSRFSTFMMMLNACPQNYSKPNKDMVTQIFFRELNLAGTNRDLLDGLYELAPQYAINARDTDLLWRDLTLLALGNLNGFGTDEEKAVLKILAALSSDEKLFPEEEMDFNNGKTLGNPNADLFLQKLIAIKPLDKTLFELLYDKIGNFGGDDNFTALMQRLYLVWFQSSYLFSRAHTIDYSSEKTLGFYQTSHDFELLRDGRNIEVNEVSDYYILEHILGITPLNLETKIFGIYDRVTLVNTSKVKIYDDGYELMSIPEIMPAFFLKGLDDDVAAKNLETGIMLAIDILTTFTGIGNALKFGRLLTLIKAVQGVAKGTKILAVVKIGVTGLEIVSGTLSAIITLADSDSSAFGQKLRSFLFWVDMATLSADAVTSKLLKKSADDALKVATKPQNMTEADFEEIIKSLENIAGVGSQGFKTLTQNQFQKLVAIKDVSITLVKRTVAVLQELGVQLLVSAKQGAGELIFRVLYKGQVLLEGTEAAIQNFLKRMSEVFDAGKKNSLKTILEADYIKKIGKSDEYGIFGGKILGKAELDIWAKILKKKYGTTLKKVESFDNEEILAQFNGQTNVISYKDGTTNYIIFHESMHAEECYKIGKTEYLKDALMLGEDVTEASLIRTYKREKYVHDKIVENLEKQGFNSDELEHNSDLLYYHKWKLETNNIEIPN
jgi:hypothetical protein